MDDPAPATPARPCRESLHALLCATLSPEELRTLAHAIAEGCGDDSIVHSLGPGSVSDLASELITLVNRRGLEYDLFMGLSRLRPRQFTRIVRVAHKFDVELPPPPPSPPRIVSAPLLHEGNLERSVARPSESARLFVAALLAVGLGMMALGAGSLVTALVGAPASVTKPPPEPPPSRSGGRSREPELFGPTPAEPASERASEPACARPSIHEIPPQERLELLIVSTRRPKNTAWITFSADLDSGEAARHILTHHFLRSDEQIIPLLAGNRLKLCVLDGCAGPGTPISALFRGADPAPARPPVAPNTESKWGLRKELADPPRPAARTDASGPDGDKSLGAGMPTVGFVLLDDLYLFYSEEPRSALACTDWNLPCARTLALPERTGRREFSLSIRLRLDATEPRSLSAPVDPYSDDCWWRDEQPLLADASGACGEAPRFALLLRNDGGLRWLIEDGADAGPGRAWSIDAPASAPRGVLDANWHHITLVRRFAEDGDTSLELWLDGALQGVETSNSRDDLADLWLAPDGALRAPWHWALKGDLGLMHLWDYALPEADLAELSPPSRSDPARLPQLVDAPS
ncbi:hypothetical protein OV203_45095 [Nannocystis sp. ILAH1]|uniref:hypothetical protein n=1 Tax=unclassified Nannocystis TaxID=2627009 RepID=UPI00226FA94D|nr:MULTISPECIES: hypothetical protein [unclassified Nannocystis]MCY0994387.1 hypothetical protein [Nannocystis sp. ILAH1]MCY1063473.1 hypothetical protein [Nannocystis sp. RBIL2]